MDAPGLLVFHTEKKILKSCWVKKPLVCLNAYFLETQLLWN